MEIDIFENTNIREHMREKIPNVVKTKNKIREQLLVAQEEEFNIGEEKEELEEKIEWLSLFSENFDIIRTHNGEFILIAGQEAWDGKGNRKLYEDNIGNSFKLYKDTMSPPNYMLLLKAVGSISVLDFVVASGTMYPKLETLDYDGEGVWLVPEGEIIQGLYTYTREIRKKCKKEMLVFIETANYIEEKLRVQTLITEEKRKQLMEFIKDNREVLDNEEDSMKLVY